MSRSSYNLKQALVVVTQDVLLLAELALAIYLGSRNPDDLSGIFLRTFIPLAALTVFASRLAIRRLTAASPTTVPTEA
ncbi:hypothetical protein RVX_R28470 [Nitratidesulfovibrio sp. HK-II]|uniref:hypothetical protein n=1 Tax=Nitratidesulfovibrio sp. HK-II TaxID=2009266 RepID=UPI000E2F8F55|nr:hypothetical protein [Nitratidesulfovibrio sp. HK-II]GBO97845.1 hypothetical protein RVX_2884 [Nitratidesulfovibrio sp. HK-II]